jgi:CRP/FNR family transcriptional regulator, cyclic AMP receptor protein
MARVVNTLEKMFFVKALPMFQHIEEDALLLMAAHFAEEIVKPGETLFEKGSLSTNMYIVVTGKVKIHDGKKTIMQMGAGEVFGELAALAPEKRIASASAVEKTLLLKINQVTIYDLIEREVNLAKGIIKLLCQKLRALQKEDT